MRNLLIILLILPAIYSCSFRRQNHNDHFIRKDSLQKHVPLADPFIMLYEGTYYAYGTHDEDGIVVFISDDLETWKIQERLALHKNDSWGDHWFWAPEVYYVDNKFYMYYTANEHICVAVADSPYGPFRQAEKRPMIENEKCIDNTLFIDDNGKPYLFFSRFNDGLNVWVAELNEDLMTIKKETLHPCIHTSQDWEKIWPRVNEGPFVVKHNGIYYMTYSANSYESPFYGIGCATSDNIMGEWIKYEQNPLLQKPKDLVGSGHHCIFTDKKGQRRLAFHAHKDKEHIHPREMYITNIDFEKQNGIDVLTIDSNYNIPVLDE